MDWKYDHGDDLKDAIIALNRVRENGNWSPADTAHLEIAQRTMEAELGATAEELDPDLQETNE